MCQFLGREIVKMGQHSFWPQKLTLLVSFWAQKLYAEDPDSPVVLISSRLEESNQETDIQHNYRLGGLFGLAQDQKIFFF